MKTVFWILMVITFLLIGTAFVLGAIGLSGWGALCMTGSIITSVLCACACVDICEYRPRWY